MLYGFAELQQKFTTGKRPPEAARVREILRLNNIKYFQDGQGRPFTTQTAFDRAMEFSDEPAANDQPPEFEA